MVVDVLAEHVAGGDANLVNDAGVAYVEQGGWALSCRDLECGCCASPLVRGGYCVGSLLGCSSACSGNGAVAGTEAETGGQRGADAERGHGSGNYGDVGKNRLSDEGVDGGLWI